MMDFGTTAFAWAATYAVHSTALLFLAWVVSRALPQPRLRELLWKGALVGSLVTATAASSLARPLGVGWSWDLASAETIERLARSETVSGAKPLGLGAGTEAENGTLTTPRGVLEDGDGSARDPKDATAGAPLATENPRTLPGWPAYLAAAWVVWAGIGLVHFLRERRRIQIALAHKRPIRTGPLLQELRAQCKRTGWARSVRLFESPRLTSPLALGPDQIVFPTFALHELSVESQRAMVAHELAHLRRRDGAWLAGTAMLARLVPFQPLLNVASRKLAHEAELLCDSAAVRTTGDGVALARSLAEVAERLGGNELPAWNPAMAARSSDLVLRVERALAGSTEEPRRPVIACTSLTILAVLATLACTGPSVRNGDSKRDVDHEELEGVEIDAQITYVDTEPPQEEPVLQDTAADALRALGYVEVEPGEPHSERRLDALGYGGMEPVEEEIEEVDVEDAYELEDSARDRLRALGYTGSPTEAPPEDEPELRDEELDALAGLGYIGETIEEVEEPVEPEPPNKEWMVLKFDSEGALRVDDQLVVAADSEDFEPLRLRLRDVAQQMPEEHSESGFGMRAGAVRIRVERETPFRRVLLGLAQLGSAEVRIWRVHYDVPAEGELRAVQAIPLPVDVHVGEHAPPNLELKLRSGQWSVASSVELPEVGWDAVGGDVDLETQVAVMVTLFDRLHPDGRITIDAGRPGVRSDEVFDMVRGVIRAGGKGISFVAAWPVTKGRR